MWNRSIFLIVLSSTLLAQTRVPFVGCESIGQAERVAAPKSDDKVVRINARLAQRLAYYMEGWRGTGVLAPRGWHCIGVYGSSGSVLYVTRTPTRDMSGPVVQFDYMSADNGSGRYDIAQVLARVFPEQRRFVQSVIVGLDPPTSDFRFGPFPKDKLLKRTDRLVEYRTPPHSEGLGTMSQLKANDDPIDGVAILQGPTPDLVMLNVRLPRELRDLAPVIIHDLLVRQSSDTR